MVASIIGGVLAVGSAIYGGIKSSQATAEANRVTQQERAKNRQWYDMRMNEDYTRRADSQAAINKAREILMEHQRNVNASQAVSGSTDEAAALAKQNATSALYNITSNIASQAASYKDSLEGRFLDRDAFLAQQQQQAAQQKAQNIAQATGQASAAITGATTGIQGAVDEEKRLAKIGATTGVL